MSWFDDLKSPGISSKSKTAPSSQAPTVLEERASRVPEGIWTKCPSCGEILQTKILKDNLSVCNSCEYHFRLTAAERIALLCDDGKFEEYSSEISSKDPLKFDDLKPYKDRLISSAKATGVKDAFVCGKAYLSGLPYHLGVFEFKFMGGSMGVVVGEKVCRVFEKSLEDKIPCVVVSASGGARMQEGILSLMQMAKTSGLIQRLQEERIPYISVCTDPTTGGVAASFAMLGDLNIAEPGALVGFAGPRVIQQTIRQALPPGAQRSEFLLKHGFLDRIVHRKEMAKELRAWLWRLGRATCAFPSSVDFS